MATQPPFQLYRSSLTGHVPAAANLLDGQLSINTIDGLMFWKNSAGAVISFPIQALVTQSAMSAYVATAVANLIQGSPAALDTLNELAQALGNDPNFAASVNTALGNRIRVDAPMVFSAVQQAIVLLTLGQLDAINNLVDGPTIALPVDTYRNNRVTIAGDRTVGVPTGAIVGVEYKLWAVQDGVGGHALTFPSSTFDFGAAGAQAISQAPNARTLITMTCYATQANATQPVFHCSMKLGFTL